MALPNKRRLFHTLRMLPLSDAFAIADQFQPRLKTEATDITSVLGSHLAEDLRALRSFPNFDHSAMDGYALRVFDTKRAAMDSPVTLSCIGESKAGVPFLGSVGAGQAVRIFTGAAIPDGATGVEMQENVTREGNSITLRKPVASGQHVRRAAEDFAAGEMLLRAGHRIGPGEIALFAAQGIRTLNVVKPPRVAILCTGSELRRPGENLAPGQIVNTNGPMLEASVREAGGIAKLIEPASDEPHELKARLSEALEADLVITVGGVSVGDHDHIPTVFKELGLITHFHHLRAKPGKPTAFATKGSTPVFALPGNPVSSFVMFEILARPMIRRLMGDPTPYPRMLRARATAGFERHPGRTEFLRAKLRSRGEALEATPIAKQGSGSLRSMLGVDALIVIPHDQGALEKGAMVDVWPLRTPGHAIPTRQRYSTS